MWVTHNAWEEKMNWKTQFPRVVSRQSDTSIAIEALVCERLTCYHCRKEYFTASNKLSIGMRRVNHFSRWQLSGGKLARKYHHVAVAKYFFYPTPSCNRFSPEINIRKRVRWRGAVCEATELTTLGAASLPSPSSYSTSSSTTHFVSIIKQYLVY